MLGLVEFIPMFQLCRFYANVIVHPFNRREEKVAVSY